MHLALYKYCSEWGGMEKSQKVGFYTSLTFERFCLCPLSHYGESSDSKHIIPYVLHVLWLQTHYLLILMSIYVHDNEAYNKLLTIFTQHSQYNIIEHKVLAKSLWIR